MVRPPSYGDHDIYHLLLNKLKCTAGHTSIADQTPANLDNSSPLDSSNPLIETQDSTAIPGELTGGLLKGSSHPAERKVEHVWLQAEQDEKPELSKAEQQENARKLREILSFQYLNTRAALDQMSWPAPVW